MMDGKQADAIAQALLAPRLDVLAARERRRAAEAAHLARKRRVAWFALAGWGVGAVIAYVAGEGFALGVVGGGLVGSTIGWLATRKAAA